MGIRACIIWRAIFEDKQEIQFITVKNTDGFPENIKKEIKDHYEWMKADFKSEIHDCEFVANMFATNSEYYRITTNWWLYDNFYVVTVKCNNPNFVWWLQHYKWNKIHEFEEFIH